MFIHLGDSKIIFTSDLIGIFNYDSKSAELNYNFLHDVDGSLPGEWSRPTSPKSFIVATGKLEFSPVSPHTLAERCNAQRF